jgi:hypothetical protein
MVNMVLVQGDGSRFVRPYRRHPLARPLAPSRAGYRSLAYVPAHLLGKPQPHQQTSSVVGTVAPVPDRPLQAAF